MPRQNALHSGEHTAGERLSKHHVHGSKAKHGNT
eukprot:CAMPEP_0180461172 /NCGR_PEP_ID=MMETSP1036_2-20121128/23742_1 /TAXON_ID=632150 /ORGANISM="Azadinium spinosum, Strain 3D9" /LENGTH=33 /DNA_ID= /DNA_START= /DNA_END= /DNA_ORIENTATION=